MGGEKDRKVIVIVETNFYDMIVINNDNDNHLKAVKDLLGKSDEALIVSPFVSSYAVGNLEKWFAAGFKKLAFITTLKEKDPDQLNKVPVLLELFNQKKKYSYKLTVRIDNSLHGKLYIGVKDGNFVGGIITSANFTENGLRNNHEWGVYFTEKNTLADIYDKTLKDTTIEITENDLLIMKQWMDQNNIKVDKSPTIDVSFIDMIKHKISSNTSVTYWLKPLGKSPNPVPYYESFGSGNHKITFTKKNPSGVKEGDVLIAYSVRSQQLISVFVAGKERGRLTHFDRPEDEQWPNYIICRNETPEYGVNWSEKGLTLSGLREEFLKHYPTNRVLPSGNELNGLQWGADHIRATPEFAEFVINVMKNKC